MTSFIEEVHRPSGGLRMVLCMAGVAVTGLALLPLQWLSCRFGLAPRRHLPTLFHRTTARIIGLGVTVDGEPADGRPLILVSNHVSWLDITALGSVTPLSFIAKTEIAAWPVFGLLARMQRSIFVDRNNRNGTGKVNAEIAERLKEGDPIVLFAESTTSDGNRILPFRSALVGAAQEAVMSGGADQVWLQPVAIAYTRLDGLPTGRMGRAKIGWYGDMDMIPHLKSVLRGGSIDVTIRFGKPVAFAPGSDRKALTKAAEEEVRRMMTEALTGRTAATPVPAPP
ncbi:MAG: lysophospholipid acyltransferase family protein [Beijerinckiaceae bacterium]